MIRRPICSRLKTLFVTRVLLADRRRVLLGKIVHGVVDLRGGLGGCTVVCWQSLRRLCRRSKKLLFRVGLRGYGDRLGDEPRDDQAAAALDQAIEGWGKVGRS